MLRVICISKEFAPGETAQPSGNSKQKQSRRDRSVSYLMRIK